MRRTGQPTPGSNAPACPATRARSILRTIETLERHDFGETEGDAPGLRELASAWTRRAG